MKHPTPFSPPPQSYCCSDKSQFHGQKEGVGGDQLHKWNQCGIFMLSNTNEIMSIFNNQIKLSKIDLNETPPSHSRTGWAVFIREMGGIFVPFSFSIFPFRGHPRICQHKPPPPYPLMLRCRPPPPFIDLSAVTQINLVQIVIHKSLLSISKRLGALTDEIFEAVLVFVNLHFLDWV